MGHYWSEMASHEELAAAQTWEVKMRSAVEHGFKTVSGYLIERDGLWKCPGCRGLFELDDVEGHSAWEKGLMQGGLYA